MQGEITSLVGAGLRATGKASIASPDAELGRLVGVKGSIGEALDATTDDALRAFSDAPTDALRPWDIAAHSASAGAREFGEFLRASGPRQARSAAGTARERLKQAQQEFRAVSLTDVGLPLNERQMAHMTEGRNLLNKALGWADDAESKATYPLADDVLEVPRSARTPAPAQAVADDAEVAAPTATRIIFRRGDDLSATGRDARIGSTFLPIRDQLDLPLQRAYDEFATVSRNIDSLLSDTLRRGEHSRRLIYATNALGAGKQALSRHYAPHDVVPGTNRTIDALLKDLNNDITTLSKAAVAANPTWLLGRGLKSHVKALAKARRFSMHTMLPAGNGTQVTFKTALEGAKSRLDAVAKVLAGTADI